MSTRLAFSDTIPSGRHGPIRRAIFRLLGRLYRPDPPDATVTIAIPYTDERTVRARITGRSQTEARRYWRFVPEDCARFHVRRGIPVPEEQEDKYVKRIEFDNGAVWTGGDL